MVTKPMKRALLVTGEMHIKNHSVKKKKITVQYHFKPSRVTNKDF